MSLRSLEADILYELRIVAKNRKIRQKDIMEWRSRKIESKAADEQVFHLSKLGVWVAVRMPEKAAKR